MTRSQPLRSDDRGVSTAVTHVLAIGITTILITGLLVGASGLLADQRQNAARNELRTIGNRLANQVAKADEMVAGSSSAAGNERVEFEVEQPAQVSGDSYSVSLVFRDCNKFNAVQPGSTEPTDACILLNHDDVTGERIEVPLELDDDVNGAGGSDVTIRLTQTGNGEFLIEACDSGC